MGHLDQNGAVCIFSLASLTRMLLMTGNFAALATLLIQVFVSICKEMQVKFHQKIEIIFFATTTTKPFYHQHKAASSVDQQKKLQHSLCLILLSTRFTLLKSFDLSNKITNFKTTKLK